MNNISTGTVDTRRQVIYIHGGFSKSTYVELLIAESQLI